MPPKLKRALSNRWFTICVHVGLWFLFYLAVVNLRGKAPEYREAESAAGAPHSPVPVTALERLFSPGIWPKSLVDTNRLNPFVTRYFIPQAPPPPTTRKIEVTYQGFFQTGDGPKQTIFKLGDAFVMAPIGARVATNLVIADATMQALILTNLAAQTNILPLNVKQELIVPIQ
jgi:hypothetical protein